MEGMNGWMNEGMEEEWKGWKDGRRKEGMNGRDGWMDE